MKKLSAGIIITFALCLLISCNKFKLPEPSLGIMIFEGTAPLINTNIFEEAEEYTVYTELYTAASIEEKLSFFNEKEAFAIIVCGSTDNNAIILKAKEYNLPLIFIGSVQEKSEAYDKAWYLSANEKHAGELIGQKVGKAFKSGELNDQNGDGILQGTSVNSTYSQGVKSVFTVAADLGVFSVEEKITATTREVACALVVEKYTGLMPAEIFICTSQEIALGINDALKQMGQAAPIAIISTSSEKTQSPLEIVPFALCEYPSDEILTACEKFISNIRLGEAVNNNSDYRLDNEQTCIFTYNLK